MTTDEAIEVAEEARKRYDPADERFVYLEAEVLEAAALLKRAEPLHYERLRQSVKDSVIDARTWASAVTEVLREQKREDAAKSDARRVEAARKAGVPIFELGSNAELAATMHAQLDTRDRPLSYDYGDVHRYDDGSGLWRVMPRSELSTAFQAWDGAPIVKADGDGTYPFRCNNVATPIDMLSDLVDSGPRGTGYFEDAPHAVAFKNGVLVIDERTGEIDAWDHDPEHRVRVGLPFDYDPDATCPEWIGYLKSVFADDEDAADKRRLLQEFAGGALFGIAPSYNKAMVLFSHGGGTGKSQTLRVFRAMFPEQAVTSIAPQDMSDDYKGAELLGSRLNIVFETPENDFISESGLKAIIGGEQITRRPIRKDPITFSPRAAHVFAANILPSAPGTTEAFWDRWIVVGYNRKFRDSNDERRELWKLIVRHELPGVVAWAVDGAIRLIRQDGYTMPSSAAGLLEAWKKEARPVQGFVEECCTPLVDVANAWTLSSELYKAYKEWAEENGFRGRLNITNFGKRLSAIGVRDKHTNEGTKYNVTLKPKHRYRGGKSSPSW